MNEAEYRRMFACEDRHWWYVALHHLILRTVTTEAAARGSLRIFDAGCGTGGLLVRLARYGSVAGCDFSPEALACCRERGLGSVTQQDLNRLALPAESFDVITCIDVLEHGWIESEMAVLERMYAALRPGGLLIVNCTAYTWLRSAHDTAVGCTRRYTRGRLRELLEKAGFHAERLTYRLFFLLPAIAAYRLVFRRKASARESASDVWLPPRGINAALLSLCTVENALLRGMNLPAGTSVFAVARKPTTPRATS